MYLREMRPVRLLSREGEIAIAKRIEAGREAMIARLCESPLTFQAIIAPVIGPDGRPIVAVPRAPPVPGSPVLAQTPAPPTGVTQFKGAPERANGEEGGETAPGE